jgi:hypothetical protein
MQQHDLREIENTGRLRLTREAIIYNTKWRGIVCRSLCHQVMMLGMHPNIFCDIRAIYLDLEIFFPGHL